MKLKYVAIFLVLLCCLMGAASAADDISADVVDDSADDAVVVNAVSQDESDSLESTVVEDEPVVDDSASDPLKSHSDSNILEASEIYIDKDTTTFGADFVNALNNIDNNGIIYIDEGTFDGTTYSQYIINNKNVSVVGKGIDKTTILIDKNAWGIFPKFMSNCNNFTFSNLTFASASTETAMELEGGINFENVKFSKISLFIGYNYCIDCMGNYQAIELDESMQNNFYNCSFVDYLSDGVGFTDKIIYPYQIELPIKSLVAIFFANQVNFYGCTFKNITDNSLIHWLTWQNNLEDSFNIYNSSFIDCTLTGYFDLMFDNPTFMNVENCWFESNDPNVEMFTEVTDDYFQHNYYNYTNGYIVAKLVNSTAIDYKNPTTFTVSLVSVKDGVETDYDGSGFANIPLTYTINGETKEGEIVNGVFTFDADLTSQSDVVKVNVGSQELTVELPEAPAEPITNDTNDTPVVPAKVATKITAPKVSAVYNVAKNLVITLTDKDGKALANKKVTVKVGTISKTLTTNAKGQVSLNVATLVPKTYTATVKFAGDDGYLASSLSPKVVVSKAKPKITAKAKTFKVKVKTKKYTVTLKNNKGKVMKKVKLTLKVGKKTYKATTNSKGKATFKITKLTKKGKYTATVKFAGSKYYKAISKKAKITVK